jgi:hypothetical protein
MAEFSEQRRAADDDRIALVIDEIRGRFLNALQLALEIGIDKLPDRAGAVQDHKSFRQHFVKFVNQSIAARWGDVTNFCSPAVHYLPPVLLLKCR